MGARGGDDASLRPIVSRHQFSQILRQDAGRPGSPARAQRVNRPAKVTIAWSPPTRGRPPGLRPGTPLDSTLALNFAGLTLGPGGYVWQLEVDGHVLARSAFRVGAAA